MVSFFYHSFPKNPKAAIFLSGTGTNAEKLLEGSFSGNNSCGWIPSVLVTDRPESCRARELASTFHLPLVEHDIKAFYRSHGLDKIALVSEEAFRIREAWTAELIQMLAPYSLDFGILAGFVPLSNITCVFPCLNVHPGDLTLEENGQRYLAGLHRIPVESALLRGHSVLRSSVILAQHFSGGPGEMDTGPILGVSSPIQADYCGTTKEDLLACSLARTGKRPAAYRGDLLSQVAEHNLERLKEHGDWVVFPQTTDDFAKNKFSLTDEGFLLYCGEPVRTVEYSAHCSPRPIPLS